MLFLWEGESQLESFQGEDLGHFPNLNPTERLKLELSIYMLAMISRDPLETLQPAGNGR